MRFIVVMSCNKLGGLTYSSFDRQLQPL